MTRSIPFTALLVVLMSLVDGDAFGGPAEAQRYPFDPSCAWGRLSDGRGLFVRCLTRDEAERLTKSAPTAAPVKSAPSAVPTPPSTASSSSAPAVANASEVADTATNGSQAAKEPLSAELVSVIADEGELPLAKRKLASPHERYAQCVMEHGGLKGASGQVEVRFLVRERGRAEGSSVEKFQGMSEAAAACIAQVVDRRQTGTGAAPVVGATAVIRVRKQAVK